jgi:hypothetical protein
MPSNWTTYGPGLTRTVALAAICATIGYAQLSSRAALEEVHIRVQLRYLSGAPINNLTARNFQVSAGAQKFPLTVEKPANRKNSSSTTVPTRALLIFSPAAKSPGAETFHTLQKVWSKRWEVCILTPDRRLTPCVTNAADLHHALQQTAAGEQSDQRALSLLHDFPGRRVIIYISNGQSKMPGQIAKSAKALTAMLYNVGGDVFQNYEYGPGEETETSLPQYGMGLYGASNGPANGMTVVTPVSTYSASASESIGDVHNERSLSTALQDGLSDAGNYYDLRLQVPPGTSYLVLGVTTKQSYKLTAQAYTHGTTPAPGLILLQPKH